MTMTKKDIHNILTKEGYKKVGFWQGLFFFSRNKVEKLKTYYFQTGIGNNKKLSLINPDAYILNGKDYLLITNSDMYIKQM